MGVRLDGARGLSPRRLRVGAVLVAAALLVGGYLYGPPVLPLLRDAATAECNELAGGDYRSYQLEWVVDVRPHWLCGDRSRPAEPAVDLGWWVAPEP
ncbi:hypothetical protein [Nocardioides pakistanensis]